ncbi:MAG: hypothetical protein HYV97_06770 [Bdellovibrio sp.]|nr:hypothetical protein [Bdellovibrio sp.]
MRTAIPPIVFVISALLLFGTIHAFYMHYHKKIFGEYSVLVKSHDKLAAVIFSLIFSLFLFLCPLFFIDDLYFWITGLEWPENEIPRWLFTLVYILEYFGMASFLGFQEYKKRLKK